MNICPVYDMSAGYQLLPIVAALNYYSFYQISYSGFWVSIQILTLVDRDMIARCEHKCYVWCTCA